MSTTTDVVIQTLRSIELAAEATPYLRPALYDAALSALTKPQTQAVAMVLAEGNRHGPDAARDLAMRL